MIQLLCLNYIIDNKDFDFVLKNNLNADYFSDYKNEFNFIKEHYDKYGVVPDKSVVLHAFKTFQSIVVSDSKQYLLDELYKDYNKRNLARIFNKIAECVNANDVDSAIAAYSQEFNSVVASRKRPCVSLLDDTSRYKTYIEKSQDYNKYYVDTGYKELNMILGGWDRKKDLVTIVGRTGRGKTWLMLKSATASLAQGLNVGIYSGEMDDEDVGYRVDTLISHISNYKLMHGDSSVQVEYKKYLESLPGKKGDIKVLTPIMIGGQATISDLRSFIESEQLDILFVDQHSLLEDERHGKSITERAANISKDMKMLQTLTQKPIIAVAQQNRESTENGVGTQHIGLTDRIGQDSTIVIMFEKQEDILTMTLTKSRNTADGKQLQYAINLDKGVFTYMPSGEDALNGVGSVELKEEFEYDGDSPF